MRGREVLQSALKFNSCEYGQVSRSVQCLKPGPYNKSYKRASTGQTTVNINTH